MLRLERLPLDACDWPALDAFPDRVLFQTREWLDFLAASQGGDPVVAELRGSDAAVGYFTGMVVRRFGVRILGSPFPGWTTPSMGFNLADGVSRRTAAAALAPFAFGALGCIHLELKDRRLTDSDAAGLGLRTTPTVTFEVDLSAPEDAIFGQMTSACRRAVRKAAKSGVVVEEAGADGFAEEYYTQLLEVFERQGLKPTYGVERVRALIRHIHPTGRLLLARARAPDGRGIATGLFPAMNGTAYFWGGASHRDDQILRPNEAVFWFAMRHWKARGVTVLDLGGGGDYKRKYGPRELTVPFFRRSRVPGVGPLRDLAKHVATRRY
jgi:CelD/BcsL family acetyltransferase involved in cellulose biosynthesis